MAGQHGAMAAFGLVASIHSSSCGIVLQTGAFQRTTPVVTCTICTAAAMLAGVCYFCKPHVHVGAIVMLTAFQISNRYPPELVTFHAERHAPL